MICELPKPRMLEEARQNGTGHKWGLELLCFLGVFFVSQILVTIPVSIATVVYLFTDSEIVSALLSGNMDEYLSATVQLTTNMPDGLMLVQLFATVLTTAVAILYCRIIEKRSAASMGLRKHRAVREYALGTLIGILLISACVGVACALGSVKLTPAVFSPVIWLLYLLGFLVQGMSEEVLCRGYLMVSVSRKNALWLAVLSNSVMFALLHLLNPGFSLLPIVNITLFGILESIYVLKRGDLWGACAIHSLWNFFQGNMFGISVSGMGVGASPLRATLAEGQAWLNGGSFGMEGGLIVTIVMSVAIVLMLFLLPAKAENE